MQKLFGLILFFNVCNKVFAQNKTTNIERVLSGSALITNNGISLIPSFNLGKPAAVFIGAIKGKKISFEPEMRFALEGKPWSFIFAWRYKLIEQKKFTLTAGINPSMSFRYTQQINNGITQNNILVKRYLAFDATPRFVITKNIAIGFYYLYSRGLDYGVAKNNNFLTFNTSISNIKISKKLYCIYIPQLYYLSQDDKNGFYFTQLIKVGIQNSPFTLQSIFNQKIKSTIVTNKNTIWNLSVAYGFSSKYRKL